MLYCKKHRLRGKAIKVLFTLVTFVVTIYYKMWFEIKCSPLMIDGPRHLLKTVQLLSEASPAQMSKKLLRQLSRGGHTMATVKMFSSHSSAVILRKKGLLLLIRF